MKAWVITLTKLNGYDYAKNAHKKNWSGMVVVSVISARKKRSYIKDYIENLSKIFFESLDYQCGYAKYQNPDDCEKATNPFGYDAYIKNGDMIIRAQLSDLVFKKNQRQDNNSLTWKPCSYLTFIIDPETNKLCKGPYEEFEERTTPQINIRLDELFYVRNSES
jgi:hypothetical protein